MKKYPQNTVLKAGFKKDIKQAMLGLARSGWVCKVTITNFKSDLLIETNSSIRPNPEGRINRKPNGRIIDETAE